jgi:hypothetical protein
MAPPATPLSRAEFQALQPEDILGATDSVGQRSDGRLLALNSYENRVYRVGMEDGPPLVAKFYRPGRWTFPWSRPWLSTGRHSTNTAPFALRCTRATVGIHRRWTTRPFCGNWGDSSVGFTSAAHSTISSTDLPSPLQTMASRRATTC